MDSLILKLMPRLRLTILTPGAKTYVCENGFPSFKTQTLCLKF